MLFLPRRSLFLPAHLLRGMNFAATMPMVGIGPSAPFSGPNSLPNLLLDMDPRTGVLDDGGAAPSNGDNVGSFTKANGSFTGGAFTNATPGLYPVWNSAYYLGLDVIYADASDDVLVSSSSNAVTDFTFFGVGIPNINWGGGSGAGCAFFSDNSNRYIGTASDTFLNFRAPGGTNNLFAVSSLGGGWNIFAFRRSGNSVRAYVKGVPSSSNPITISDTFNLDRMFNRSASDRPFSGYFGRAILYTDAKSNADMNLVGQYLATLFGLTWTAITV